MNVKIRSGGNHQWSAGNMLEARHVYVIYMLT